MAQKQVEQDVEPEKPAGERDYVLEISYGSNIADPAEVDDPAAGVPIKLRGYKRHVQLPASYRRPAEELGDVGEADDRYRGVFNIEETDGAWISAIMYKMSPQELDRMNEREAQYEAPEVPKDSVEPYVDDPRVNALIQNAEKIIIRSSDNPRDPEQHPNPQYLAEVFAGAKEWDQRMGTGTRFFKDLLKTSEVDDGETLQDYLQKEGYPENVLLYIVPPDDVSKDDWGWERFEEYEGSVEVDKDFWTGVRKWRNNDLDWTPSTDEDLSFELRYMSSEERREFWNAVADEHGEENVEGAVHYHGSGSDEDTFFSAMRKKLKEYIPHSADE